jgi:hypothetical protein
MKTMVPRWWVSGLSDGTDTSRGDTGGATVVAVLSIMPAEGPFVK